MMQFYQINWTKFTALLMTTFCNSDLPFYQCFCSKVKPLSLLCAGLSVDGKISQRPLHLTACLGTVEQRVSLYATRFDTEIKSDPKFELVLQGLKLK